MNDLYLIGNGFDLSHGLKTSYNDFLLWYLNDSLQRCNAKDSFNDNLIKVKRGGYHYSELEDYDSVKKILGDMRRMNFSIEYSHKFFENLIENYNGNKWVDIEYEYYMALVEIYRDIERDNELRSEFHFSFVKPLNECFDAIKKKLIEYLLSVKMASDLKNKQIEKILFEETGIYQEGDTEGIEEVFERMVGQPREEKLFVCFNYTNTLGLYLRHSPYENNLIYIHGELDGTSNPIIFGYGDEVDPHYEKIENLNRNEFLKNIKSFCYLNTSNYQDTIRFIGSGNFTVKILGHSCGLSDRILLNTIFEHPNCKAIKIFYYKKNEMENDFREKTQEISRHFKALGKGDMRIKIVPLEKSIPLPQNKKS